jgi:hypothetical protein
MKFLFLCPFPHLESLCGFPHIGEAQDTLVTIMHGNINRRTDDDSPGTAPPFPSASTFFGIALALIVLWLLASGARELLHAPPDTSAPVHTGQPLGSK